MSASNISDDYVDLSFDACAHRVQLAGRTEFLVFVRDEVGILLNESFSRRPKIELFGMIAEEFAMDACPHQAPISVDVYFGYAEFRRGQVFFFVHATRRRIKFSAGGVDPFNLRFRDAR